MISVENILSRKNALSVLSGIIFVAVFFGRYSLIENDWYQYRDDGLITMSSGRNLVDYHFIGVNPSGPRVEASSSPLQLFVYALAYFFMGTNYADFSYWQTLIATFLIGFLFIRFFSTKPLVSISAATVSAVGMTYFYAFFEWHASGMENAIAHVLFLTTAYITYDSVRLNRINYAYSFLVFLAAISRIDSVLHIGAFLLIFSVYWFVQNRNPEALIFSLMVFGFWIVFQLWRFHYFGDLLPNTAHAQNIHLGERIEWLLLGNREYLRKTLDLSLEILNAHGAWLLYGLIPLYHFLKPERENIFLIFLVISIVFTSFVTPFLFGPARIDIARTTTSLTMMVVLSLANFYYFSRSRKHSNLLILLLFPIAFGFYRSQEHEPYILGWTTSWFDINREMMMEIAEENNINRPTIANPDLGVVTWHKQFNVLDLGKLGSPIMAQLENGPMLTEYLLTYGLPDIIEAHGYWVREYCESIFSTEEFSQKYSQVGSDFDIKQVCVADENPPRIFWIRNDIKLSSSSSERILLNDLQDQFSAIRVSDEIRVCEISGGNCSYIARTVYKFIPELIKTGQFSEIYNLFERETDKALLLSWKNGQSHQVIMDAVQDNAK